jgi:gamma-glutamylcyclotransferase (GGCT)/AIG2-like uncharacterized protein YtfP
MPFIFVYGTLKRGGTSNGFLASQRYVGPASTEPAFRLHQLDGYPGMVPASPGGYSVEGEIWEVDRECLKRLDKWEGTDIGLYARAPIRLLPPNSTLEAEAYIYLKGVAGRPDLGPRFG